MSAKGPQQIALEAFLDRKFKEGCRINFTPGLGLYYMDPDDRCGAVLEALQLGSMDCAEQIDLTAEEHYTEDDLFDHSETQSPFPFFAHKWGGHSLADQVTWTCWAELF